MREEWKDIVGYDGVYKVSNTGRIMSYNHYRNSEPHEMSLLNHNSGYLCVGLSKNRKATHYLVHRLVAEAFIPNPNGYDFVNHKDENKKNNSVENLEWCTKSQNSIYYLNFDPRRKKEYADRFRDKATGEMLSSWTKKGVPHKVINQ